jgi:hypothetical protein
VCQQTITVCEQTITVCEQTITVCELTVAVRELTVAVRELTVAVRLLLLRRRNAPLLDRRMSVKVRDHRVSHHDRARGSLALALRATAMGKEPAQSLPNQVRPQRDFLVHRFLVSEPVLGS